MRINKLNLENIGPFKSAELEFISTDDNFEEPPVIIITGENGTGKTVIIDAIRTLFYGVFTKIERDLTFNDEFLIKANISVINETNFDLFTDSKKEDGKFKTNVTEFNKLFTGNLESIYKGPFVVDYWTSKLSNDEFGINNIEAPKTSFYLKESLTGIHRNVDVTKLITFFDYLSDSKDEKENEIGKAFYDLIKLIIDLSINNGILSHVSRTELIPKILIQNQEVSLNKLSSGNLYLIQRFVVLLGQVYSACITYKIPVSEVRNIKGLLLIDEAENHLHPKWQKVFQKNLLKIFPKLQIIVTTHSPFIVSSIENARVFVCTSDTNESFVKEETDYYTNKPIEEILLSPLFNTSNFNEEISELIRLRKNAISTMNLSLAKQIEVKLLDINPNYFNFLTVEELIKSIKK